MSTVKIGEGPPDVTMQRDPAGLDNAATAAPMGSGDARVLGGRYKLGNFLGSGGFGSTYVAQDQRLRRECVLKLLKPMSSPPTEAEQGMRRRFTNEALALAHLTHPNVVQAYDHGEEPDGTAWIAMEFAPGRALNDVMTETRQMPVSRAVSISQQIAAALATAHARGIVHRDLKPGNIILVESSAGEQVKVLDFGIARIIQPELLGMGAEEANVTTTGAFFGTPAYMSPEQAGGAQVGPESDIYSLGVVLYRMLTGVLPGKVPDHWSPITTARFIESPAEPIRKFRPDVPPGLAELLQLMLVKNPRQRTLSASQLSAELSSFGPTDTGSFVVRNRSHSRQMRLVLIGAAAVVALVAAAGYRLHVSQVEARDAEARAEQRRLEEAEAARREAEQQRQASLAKAQAVLADGLRHLSDEDPAEALALLEEASLLGGENEIGKSARSAIEALKARPPKPVGAPLEAPVSSEPVKPAPAPAPAAATAPAVAPGPVVARPAKAGATPKPAASGKKPGESDEFPDF